MAVTANWLVGSIVLLEDVTVVVAGNNKTISAGTYYLYDAMLSRSLIGKLEAVIQTEVAGASVELLQNRKVRIDFDAVSTTIAIPADLQDVLGFTSSPYAGATSRTAEAVSTILWSGGYIARPANARVGAAGYRVTDRVLRTSPSGLTFYSTKHHTATRNSFSWNAVREDRAWPQNEAPGSYVIFEREVIEPRRRFKIYTVVEDDASSSAASLGGVLGPYIAPNPDPQWYQRFVDNTDSCGANILGLDVIVVGEP